MRNGKSLTQGELRSLLHYDPETGVFRWVKPVGNIKAGSVAGTIHHLGYRDIQIAGRKYSAHRLAWLYMTGEWPAEEIDHRNTVPGDDRWENLREATCTQNNRNSRKRRSNTSGVKGVTWNVKDRRWRAQIRVDRRVIYLGNFADVSAAAAAYAAASERYHGEFGRTT